MKKRTLILGSVVGIVFLLTLVVYGTYAVFTAQVMSDIQDFDAGTVIIDVNGEDHMFPTTLHMAVMEPGDKMTQTITINNNGTLPVNYDVYVDYGYDPNDIFHCDGANSMQAWADPATGGPIAPAASATSKLTAELPLAAGNSCQGKSGKLRVTVHAVQASNLADFTCIKLVYKDEWSDPPWIPYGDSDPRDWALNDHRWMPQAAGPGQHGNLCYKSEGGKLRVVMNAYGLTPSAYYQLALNGPGGSCAPPSFEDSTFAGILGGSPDIYHAGWSSGSMTALSSSCINYWDEGVYNFYGTDGELQADTLGNISLDYTIGSEAGTDPLKPALPNGTYNNVKFIVKEIRGYPGAAPSHPGVNHGNLWLPLLMEIRQLSFTLP